MAEAVREPSSGKVCCILLIVLLVAVLGGAVVFATMPELLSLGFPRLVSKVTIKPEEAAGAGGQWRLVGQWQGAGSPREAEGIYLVEFKPLPGWESPAPVVLKKGEVGASIEGVYKPVQYSEETILTLAGATTLGSRLMPELAQRYLKRIGADEVRMAPGENPEESNIQGVFYADREIRSIRILGRGTPFGIAALKDGQCDVALSAQKLSSLDLRRMGAGVLDEGSERRLGMDAVAVVVHRDNPVASLTVDQVGGVFSGEITNWEQLGGPSMPIKAVGLAESFGTSGFFGQFFMGGRAFSPAVRLVDVHSMVADVVSRDPWAIGFCSIALAGQCREMPVRFVPGAEPVAPSMQNIRTLAYQASRSVYLYVRADNRNVHAFDFLGMSLGTAGQEIVRNMGFVPNAEIPADTAAAEEGMQASLNVEAKSQAVLKAPPVSGPLPKLAQLDGEVVSDEERRTVLQGVQDGVFGAQRLPFVLRFQPGSLDLEDQSARDVGRLAELMKEQKNSAKVLVLVGYSDSAGAYASNLAVSVRRAETVADALGARGVTAVSVVGAGEEGAVETNESRAGRERNRRVEVWLK